MSYATTSDMISRFGEDEVVKLSDRKFTGVIDIDVLNGALAEADAEIDPYLAPHYLLPLATIPRILTGYACDIARYRLCGAGITETEQIRTRYADAVKFLTAVAHGKLSLGLDTANHTAQTANTVQFATTTGRVFDRSSRG